MTSHDKAIAINGDAGQAESLMAKKQALLGKK